MKKPRYTIILSGLIIFLLLGVSGCNKKDEFPTYPEPTWQVNHDDYSVSMTAVVALPSNLASYATENDHLAAFTGSTCRGVGELVDGLYYVTIKGTPEDESEILFRYYNGRNQYLYKTQPLFFFEKDRVYGSTDTPEVLPLNME